MSDEIPRDLSRLYRAGARADPPARLDAAILRSARQESLASAPRWRGTFTSRWGVPMALAAVMVLSVSLVMVMREEQAAIESDAVAKREPDRRIPEMPPSGNEATAQSQPLNEGYAGPVGQPPVERQSNDASAVAQRPQAKAEESGSSELPRGNAAPMRQRDEVADRPASSLEAAQAKTRPAAGASAVVAEPDLAKERSAPSPAAVRAPAEVARDAGAVSERREAKKLASESTLPPAPAAVGSAVPAARAPAPPAGAAIKPDATGDQLGEQDSPDRWLRHIAQLRKEGRASEAQASLEEFRKRYPTYPIPEALR